MEPLDDKNTAQLLQQMRRQTEIRPEQEESSGMLEELRKMGRGEEELADAETILEELT